MWKHLILKVVICSNGAPVYEKFEDIKGVIRNRKSKKERQHNGKKKIDKIINDDLQNIHIQLNLE